MKTPKVIGEVLRLRAREHGDQPYLRSGDEEVTYGDMDARSDRVAAGLAEIGVRQGDRVAIISSNRMEMLELFFAVAKMGAVQVPLNAFLKGEFLAYQLEDSQAQTLVVDGPGAQAITALLPDLPDLRRLVVMDPAGEEASGLDVVPYEAIRQSEASPIGPEVRPESLMSILYTSGTTGMPKGCMLPHGWYINGATVSSEMVEYTPDDVPFTALPLFHAWAQGTTIGVMVHHLRGVVDPVFSISNLLERFIETGATVFMGVGMMGLAMLGAPPSDRDRQHHLRVALMFPFTPEQQEQFEARFGVQVLTQLYGQTETGAIAYSRVSEPRNRASLGRPAPYFEVKLFDDDDHEVPVGEVGEIVVRPKVPNAIYLGYWRNPEATNATWRNLWHHTGDFGRADAEGFITFVDRKKDALRRRGENVSSIEVERAIVKHPKITEAAVHAIPSEMSEDDIKACVVLEPGQSVEPDELFAFLKENLPYFAVPRYVEVLSELPKNATLRVMKHLLRERGVTGETWDFDALGLSVDKAERR
jgi:crotonobetaine/carnitine-CoA ligase